MAIRSLKLFLLIDSQTFTNSPPKTQPTKKLSLITQNLKTFHKSTLIQNQVNTISSVYFLFHVSFTADQPESTSETSSSSHSSRHCSLNRSNSYDGYGVYVSTDIETHCEHFIQQVEEFSPGDEAGLKENDRILCINGTPVIDEDYTVVLQLIKHGLDTDTLDFDVMANDAYEEFKSQMNSMS